MNNEQSNGREVPLHRKGDYSSSWRDRDQSGLVTNPYLCGDEVVRLQCASHADTATRAGSTRQE
jgi:hypothetical protein